MTRKTPLVLLCIYLLIWVWAAIEPLHRDDWLLENVLPAIFISILIVGYRKFQFSNVSYLLIFIFMLCHVLGSHYTYAEVPYGKWLHDGFNIDSLFNSERNHYDRLIHFSYGLLLVLPYREWLISNMELGSKARFWLPLEFIVATSAFYELMEWGAAVVFGGDLGMLFLGTQGDIWDAHWDMLLASSGGCLALLLSGFCERFTREEIC